MTVLKTILLLILTASMLLYFFWGFALQLQQLCAIEQMEEKMECENLIAIHHLTSVEYKWIDEGKEMRIEGRLFDVKQFVQHYDGTIDVTGLFDLEEDAVIERIKNETDSKSNSGFQKIFSAYFLHLLACNQSQGQPLINFADAVCCLPNHYQQILTSFTAEIPTPPPQSFKNIFILSVAGIR